MIFASYRKKLNYPQHKSKYYLVAGTNFKFILQIYSKLLVYAHYLYIFFNVLLLYIYYINRSCFSIQPVKETKPKERARDFINTDGEFRGI